MEVAGGAQLTVVCFSNLCFKMLKREFNVSFSLFFLGKQELNVVRCCTMSGKKESKSTEICSCLAREDEKVLFQEEDH